jgi:hypothetical protein
LKLIRDQVIVWGLTLLDFVSRFHLPRHSVSCTQAVLSVVALTLTCAPGCRRVPGENTIAKNDPAAKQTAAALSLIPPDAEIVLSLDLDRLRGQPAWTTVLSALAKHARPFLEGLATGTGLDVPRQLHRVLVAFPAERQSDDRFVLIADADLLDDARVATWLHARLGEKAAIFIRNKSQIVISQGAWSGTMAALASATKLTPSAADRPELLRLCTRAAIDHSLWFAAIVPAAVRRGLMQEPRFADVASITRVSGSINLNSGALVEVVAELSNTADATLLARRLGVYLNQAKRHPEMLVRGVAPNLESVRLAAHDARVHATLDLSGEQFGECIERIEALAHGTWTK